LKIIQSLPANEKIIFGPDKNLGNYVKSVTGRENMLVWNGVCHVHEAFSVEKIIALKKAHPDAKVLAHPECRKQVLLLADYIGSTAALLAFSVRDECKKYIVATESGIIHQMQKESPKKEFIPVPPDSALNNNDAEDSCGACSDCEYMKLIDLEKIYLSLLHERHEIIIPETVRQRAEKSILNMLHL
jgi:quinolinate synthase